MEFRILGPLEVVADGQTLRLGGPKQRALLALLLTQANRVVPVERLSEVLWGDAPPDGAAATIQVYISQLRKQLEPNRKPQAAYRILVSQPPGYLLRIGPDQLDLYRFERFKDTAFAAVTAGDAEAAATSFRQAIAVWRGPALADFATEPWALGEAGRMNEMRLQALEQRIDADLVLGRHADLTAELETIVAEYPFRERLRGQLMVALYRSGRQAEASDVFHRTREKLVEELGMEPGPDLQKLLKQILNQDPSLEIKPRPLKSQQSQPHNLPVQLTSFVGRHRELEAIEVALANNRLVTMTGAGGSGKTRLAIQAAAVVVHNYADGACFVDLSLVTDPSLVATGFAAGLVLRVQPGQSVENTVLEQLAQKRLLLVVDNCEHIIEACALLVGRILASAPEVRVLATSQEPLNLPGEVRWSVPSLGLPAADQPGVLDALLKSEAGQLFIDRAQLAKPEFALSERTALAVAEVCRRLDGIPLAIELAAAQIAVMTSGDIVARLSDRFRLLGTGKRMVAPRQRTLLATVMWSHDLLTESQKVLFRRLSVFAGGFDLDAAEAMGFGGSVEVDDVLSLLKGLVEKSLVVTGEDFAGRARYRLLETLREFARARLIEVGEETTARAAHLDHYLGVARQAEPHLLGTPDQSEWLASLDQDIPELRGALVWGFAADPVRASELATCLGWFWWFRGYVAEGLDWMEMVMAVPTIKPTIRGAALAFAGRLASRQSAHQLAAGRFLEAVGIFRRLDNLPELAFAIFDLGTVARATGHFTRARILLDASRAMWRRLGDDRLAVYAVQELGVLAMMTGDAVRSEELFLEAIEHLRASDERWGLALNLANLAELRIRRGDTGGARALLAESLDITELLVDPVLAAQLFDYIGMLAIDEGLATTGLSLFAAGHALREHQRVKYGTAHQELLHGWRSRGERILGPAAADSAWRSGLDLAFPAAVAMARSIASDLATA